MGKEKDEMKLYFYWNVDMGKLWITTKEWAHPVGIYQPYQFLYSCDVSDELALLIGGFVMKPQIEIYQAQPSTPTGEGR